MPSKEFTKCDDPQERMARESLGNLFCLHALMMRKLLGVLLKRVGWKVDMRTSYQVLTFLTNGINVLQQWWKKYVDSKEDYAEK